MTVVALVAAVTAAVGSASGAASTGPKPCLIMDGVIHDTALTEKFFDAAGHGGAHCEWDSKPPPGQLQGDHQVVLYVLHERSATIAKGDYGFLTKQNCARTRVRGADAACSHTVDAGKATSMRIVWLRGSYTGWLVEAGPGKFGLQAQADLGAFLPGMPR
jgi:hypothetical protein